MFRNIAAIFAALSIMMFATFTFTTAHADGGANTNTQSEELTESLKALRSALKELGYDENSAIFQATIDPNADVDASDLKALRSALKELGYDENSAIFQATIDPDADIDEYGV